MTRLLRWSAACTLLVGSSIPAPAQGRETLETKVTVRGDRVQLEWSARHPWDATLLSNAPVLFAEYRTPGGQVALDCLINTTSAANARRGCTGLQAVRDRGARERSLSYVLPPSLARVPEGAACLVFRMPDQRPLPLRRVDRDRSETARFRYPEWEALARRDVERAALDRRLRDAQAAVEAKRAEIATIEQRNREKGWETAPACEAIPAPNLEDPTAQRPLPEPREHEIVARQVCVMRVQYAVDQLAGQPLARRLGVGAVLPPSVLDTVLALLPRAKDASPALSADRQQQLAIFRRDFAQLAPQVARYRDDIRQAGYSEPHFGSFDDYLSLQSYAKAAGTDLAERVSAGETPRSDFVLGWVGGNLEAYTRCVGDGQVQLATAVTAATDLATRRPALQESARRAFVKACHDGVGRLEALRAQLGPLELQVVAAERALAELRPPPALPERAREVNQDACVP